VIDALLPALRSGLLAETAPGQFRFSHTLVRDAIDDALGSSQRAALHGRAEAALATLGERADVLLERARHALAAPGAVEPGAALAVAARAAALLERERAFDRAFELHARIAQQQRAGLLPPASPEWTLHVAEIARAAGRSDASRTICEELIAQARASGDAELLSRAALLHGTDVRPAVVDRAQVALLEEALAMLGDRTAAISCRVRARLSTAVQPASDQAVPQALARDAIASARAIGDAAALLDVLELSLFGLYAAPLSERIQNASELLERALLAGDVPKALSAYSWLAFNHVYAGDFAAFTSDTESMLALSDDIGHPRHRWRALLLASCRALALGHFAESDRYVTEVAQLAALVDEPALPPALLLHRAMQKKLQRKDDELAVALEEIEAALASAHEAKLMIAMTRVGCAARALDVQAARAELAVIGSRAHPIFAEAGPGAYIGEALALTGSDDERRLARAALARLPDTELTGAHILFTYEGPLARVLGLLDASHGDLASAERELRAALEPARARKHAPWVAQIAFELGSVLLRAGREREARALLEESARIARELDMPGLLRSLQPAAPAAPPTAAFVLTMTRRGDVWSIERGAAPARVKDSRGMRMLARLVDQPGQELHVLALASDDATSTSESNAGEVIDERARKVYRARLLALDAELEQAEAAADAARSARLERERSALAAELARAVGLGGRARLSGSSTERARVNVQKRIKEAIARVHDVDAALGQFLEAHVSTGTFCCFRQ
jgi:hypothetical protein